MDDYRTHEDHEERPPGIAKSSETDTSWEFASIGEVADEFGFTLRALRFYEEKGLISPRRSGNRRLYSPRDRRRLEIIAQGKRIGLALEEIREILRAGGEASNGARRHLEVALEKAQSRMDEIHAEQQQLQENLQEALLLIADLKARLGKAN